ncbi:cytotoxic translational repressor of toxin-antitoxin stability system [Curtobacterium sp. SP.BCo]|uniref:cytotoxic translational repressor of toxin-antitoxin stability system n=1 Tax=Curtobacterium sp. SP.BCo TaxID=3435229 RepID=UPI003F737B94
MSSTKPPAPSREHHDAFCTTEDWQLVRGATGRPVRHHRTYELTRWDARILRTRISEPVDRSTYPPRMWAHILREQLAVDSPAFWACVEDGVLPDRGGPARRAPSNALPLYLVRALRDLDVPEERILDLDPSAAAALHAELLQSAHGH